MTKSITSSDWKEICKYLRNYEIAEIFESVITAIAFYRPRSPYKAMLEYIKRIQHENIRYMEWDHFIDEEDLRVKKVYKPSFVEYHLFQNPALSSSIHKNMVSALELYYHKLRIKYFNAMKNFKKRQVEKRRIAQVKWCKAIDHHLKSDLQKAFNQWKDVVTHRQNRIMRAYVILHQLNLNIIRRSMFDKWCNFIKEIRAKSSWYQNQALKNFLGGKGTLSQTNIKQGDVVSNLPKNIALKIFNFLDLKSKISSLRVSSSWHTLLQDCALFTELNFTESGIKIDDGIVEVLLKRNRVFVHHIKLAQCNHLSDNCLLNLAECKNLRDLDLSQCKVSSNLLLALNRSCPFICYINLSWTPINDTCLSILSKFSSLRYIDISYCDVITPHGFALMFSGKTLPNISHINLSGCKKVSPEMMSYIGQSCVNISCLLLDDMPSLNDACISSLAAMCPKLDTLSLLYASNITDSSLKFISWNLKQLTKLFLEGNTEFTSDGISSLFALKKLRVLHLVDCLRVFDDALHAANTHEYLEVVNFTDCVRLTDTGLGFILDSPSAANLTEISVVNCVRVGDKALQAICTNCPKLICLNISYCENVTHHGLSYIHQLNVLCMLDLSGCAVNERAASSLCLATKISYLTLSECNLLNDSGLEKISKLQYLRYIDLSYCTNITDAGMKALLFGQNLLSFLNIAGCKNITNATLTYISNICSYLQHLNIAEINGVNNKGIRSIKSGCDVLRRLVISEKTKLDVNTVKQIMYPCAVEIAQIMYD